MLWSSSSEHNVLATPWTAYSTPEKTKVPTWDSCQECIYTNNNYYPYHHESLRDDLPPPLHPSTCFSSIDYSLFGQKWELLKTPLARCSRYIYNLWSTIPQFFSLSLSLVYPLKRWGGEQLKITKEGQERIKGITAAVVCKRTDREDKSTIYNTIYNIKKKSVPSRETSENSSGDREKWTQNPREKWETPAYSSSF